MKKKRYSSYDLVVFSDYQSYDTKNLNNIDLVLEYNGPWHYTKQELVKHGNEPAVPYKINNKFIYTKYQVFIMDQCKLNHISKYTNNILIYWEKTKTLSKYKVEKNYD